MMLREPVEHIPKEVHNNQRHMRKFGQRVRHRLAELDKTEGWLAEQTGIVSYEMMEYVLGYSLPDMRKGMIIAKVLQVDPWELVRIGHPEEPDGEE